MRNTSDPWVKLKDSPYRLRVLRNKLQDNLKRGYAPSVYITDEIKRLEKEFGA